MAKYKIPYHLIGWGILILIFLCASCTQKPYALAPVGVPIKQQGDRVLTLFEEHSGSQVKYHATWFYFPGMYIINPHDYQIRVILERRIRP